MRRLLLVSAALAFCASAAATDARTKYHTVQSVPRGDRVVVKYEGLSVTIRLAHVAVPDDGDSLEQARKMVEAMAKGRRVRVSYSEEVGLDESGLPRAYIVLRKSRNVNEALVKAGLARYDPAGTDNRFYHSKMEKAQQTARKKKAGLWGAFGAAAEVVEKPARRGAPRSAARGMTPGRFYSQINNSLYHVHTCRWARKISSQRRIQYTSAGAAERAGKRPCFTCLAERAETALFGGKKSKIPAVLGKGKILAYNGQFHAPTCSKIQDHADKVVSVKSFDSGRRLGLQPCELCLRLGGGMIPLPEKGECAGRAPPMRRPCRRAPADESGLCLLCQGRE